MASKADQEYSNQDTTTDDIPQGSDTFDNSYATGLTRDVNAVPIVKDVTSVEQPNEAMNPDSDEMLEQDEKDAINSDNIIGSSRKGIETRHAAKPAGTYQEPGDEEGLPENTGRSARGGLA